MLLGHRPGAADRTVDDAAQSWHLGIPARRQAPRGQWLPRHLRCPSASDLAKLPRSGRLIAQDYLPGDEYSIDVLADRVGHVVASVPRLRARVDSGISVGGRTIHEGILSDSAWQSPGIRAQVHRQRSGPQRCAGPPVAARRQPAGARIARAHDRERCRYAAIRDGRPARTARYPSTRTSARSRWSASLTSGWSSSARSAGRGVRRAALTLDRDYHVHSTFSDGVSTVTENVSAAERGLRLLCLTDHVRGRPPGCPSSSPPCGHSARARG